MQLYVIQCSYMQYSAKIYRTMQHDAFECASSRAWFGRLFAQAAWLRDYDLRQSTRLKLIPSCPAGRVIGLGNSGLSAPDYFCAAIIGQRLVATDAKWLWMESSIFYILCQLSRSINIRKKHSIVNLKCPCFLFRY